MTTRKVGLKKGTNTPANQDNINNEIAHPFKCYSRANSVTNLKECKLGISNNSGEIME